MQQFGTQGHRYFGILYLSCKGCDELKTYWLYVRHGDRHASFYAKRGVSDTFQVNAGRLAAGGERELAALVPEERRMYVRE